MDTRALSLGHAASPSSTIAVQGFRSSEHNMSCQLRSTGKWVTFRLVTHLLKDNSGVLGSRCLSVLFASLDVTLRVALARRAAAGQQSQMQRKSSKLLERNATSLQVEALRPAVEL